jgi:hypothetical protein
MAHRDQKKYIENLKRYENKMSESERYDYKMFVKRHKDDEDLDKRSMEKLRDMYEKYHVNRERKNFDHFFKSDN